MKKIIVLTIVLLFQFSFSQDVFDGMRFANHQQFGTARFTALGGAMGALGGDFSAMNVNPAGSAIFNENQFSGTFNIANYKNKSNYFGSLNTTTDTNLDISQAGVVWVFTENKKADWDKITFGINYEKTNNFTSDNVTAGFNPNNSIANYFLSYANGVPINDIVNNDFENLSYGKQQVFLGYEGYIISNQIGSTTQYKSDISGNGNFYQRNAVQSLGYSSKVNFNLGSSYKNRYFFGVNLNAHFTDFTRSATFTEDYRSSPGHLTNTGVQSIRFSNDLYTYGTGFSAQFGAIAKITDSFRAGLTYESPTWFRLNDESQQTLNITCSDCGTKPNTFFADPNLKVIYPTYRLRTPSKTTASLAYIIGKKGLLSLDYALKNYSGTKFGPSGDYSNVNNEMNATFSEKASEIRLGGEYRIKQISLRAGYRYEQSPYVSQKTIGDLTAISGGLGYDFGNFKMDFAVMNYSQNSQQQFFSQGLIDRAAIDSNFTNSTVTFVFKL